MSLLSLFARVRVFATLLVATIAIQAIPAGAIVKVDRGPAFSASSMDVAIAVRSEANSAPRLAPVPVFPPQIVKVPVPLANAIAAPRAYQPALPIRGPPRRTLPSPREPPLS